MVGERISKTFLEWVTLAYLRLLGIPQVDMRGVIQLGKLGNLLTVCYRTRRVSAWVLKFRYALESL